MKRFALVSVLSLGVLGYLAYQILDDSQLTLRDVLSGNIAPLASDNLFCTSCESWLFQIGQYQMDALTLEATYLAKRAGTISIAFADGDVQASEVKLEPGCHTLTIEEGTRLTFNASNVHISFPAKADTCSKLSERS